MAWQLRIQHCHCCGLGHAMVQFQPLARKLLQAIDITKGKKKKRLVLAKGNKRMDYMMDTFFYLIKSLPRIL